MFGHIQANLNALGEEDQKRYRSAYCGLCRCLGKRHGFLSRLSLTYDLTFLSLLLSSLYEPNETCGRCCCLIHPCKKRSYHIDPYTEYAADMTIALAYYKCLDDWSDDKRLWAWLASKCLKKKYKKVKQLWPKQCDTIERELTLISQAEQDPTASADDAANGFGRMMAGLFTYHEDIWENTLHCLGYGIGRFIYFADAAIDYDHDKRAGRYNPLLTLDLHPEQMRSNLKLLLGDASQAFEFLPLVKDASLLRNIVYSGIWIKYDRHINKTRKTDHD